MQIKVVFDTSRLKADLKAEQDRITRTARRAVNELAFLGRDAVQAEIRKAFDRPTPYIVQGVTVDTASDTDLVATVTWKDASGNKSSGPGAGRVLRAQVEGGARRLKAFERAIGLPANRIAVPAKWAELDQYGGIKAGQIVKILSYLRLFGEQGYTANRRNRPSRGTRRGESYFIIRPGADHRTLSPGIYRVGAEVGGAPLMVLAFVRAANYRARLAPADAVRAAVQRNAAQVWTAALERRLPFRR